MSAAVCRDTALLVLSCNEAVTGLCAPAVSTCITIAGPSNATVQYVNQVDGTSSFYNTFISWDVSALLLCSSAFATSADCCLASIWTAAVGSGLLTVSVCIRNTCDCTCSHAGSLYALDSMVCCNATVSCLYLPQLRLVICPLVPACMCTQVEHCLAAWPYHVLPALLLRPT